MCDRRESKAAGWNPRLGALARDRARDRVGVVMGRYAGQVYLRPQGGGVEWTARPEDLDPADRRDELTCRVRELNANSSQGRPW